MNELTKRGLKFTVKDGQPTLKDIIPFNPRAALHKATEMCMQGNAEQSIPIFKEVMEYPECRALAGINLANAYLDTMNLEEALQLALEHVKLDRESSFGYQTLAKIYMGMEDIKSAEKCLIFADALKKSEATDRLWAELFAYKNKFQEYYNAIAKLHMPRLYLGNQSFCFECMRLFDKQKPENHTDIFGHHNHTIETPVFIQQYEVLKQIGYEFLEYRGKNWSGENLDDKTLLIYSEQGLGDNVCFFSLIKKLKAKYRCKIMLATYDQLHCIANQCEYIDEVLLTIFDMNKLIEADYVCNIYQLPQFISIDDEGPYLPIFTHKKLLNTGKKKVLVNWVSKPNLARVKRFDLQLFSDILNKHTDSMSFYICQRSVEEDRIKSDIIRFSLPVEIVPSITLEDLFSYIYDADLIVTTDTLHVHAAGGLGKDTVLLLSRNITMPAWGKDVEKVPNYRTVKLIRDLKKLTI